MTPGTYTSNLAQSGLGGDKPEPVTLMGHEDGGWWFLLPDTWPHEAWRGDTRWFSYERGSFTPDEEQ